MAKKDQKKIDTLASARSRYTKGSKEYNRIQNNINELSGVSKRHDTSNALTSKQMAIAKAGRSEIVAGQKFGVVKKAVAKAEKGYGKTKKKIDKALAGVKTKKRNYMAGD